VAEPKPVRTIEELDALYGAPLDRALIKELDTISAPYRAFIEKSPFVVMATSGPEGLDCSPRGDPAGFVRVLDPQRVALPDRRGNNRLDSLRNLVRDPRVSLLFLVPGVGETLRINGRAEIRVDEALCRSFSMRGKAPVSVVVVSVDRVYYQCQKALVRSRLWSADSQVPRSSLPSAGAMLEELSDSEIDGSEYDRRYPERMKKTLY